MKIVNVIKDSFNECAPFSWGITLFCFGCNLHCKMCEGYDYETISNKDNITGTAIELIDKYITPMHDCVIFLGGEPTIWGDSLIEALRHCKDKGLKTKVFSNGMLPEVVEKINTLKLCDSWSIDFKGIDNIKEQFGENDIDYLSKVLKTINNIVANKLPLEVRTTFFEGNEKDRNSIISVGEAIIDNYKRQCPEIYCKYIIQEDVRPYLPPKDVLRDE